MYKTFDGTINLEEREVKIFIKHIRRLLLLW